MLTNRESARAGLFARNWFDHDHRRIMLPFPGDRLHGVFDDMGRLRRPPVWRLARELASLFFYHPPAPQPEDLPAGDGHVVLVIPAFLTSDRDTQSLRRFLAACGYCTFGWDLGLNFGPTQDTMKKLRARLPLMRDRQSRPISIVGVSLGGLLALAVARDHPECVRRVVTLASPFCLPTASSIEPLIRLSALFHPPALDMASLGSPLPVPTTAVYTCDDGIVAWESCRRDEPNCHPIQVRGAHMTICRKPAVLRALAQTLAVSA